MTKNELVDEIARRTPTLPRHLVSEVVSAVFGTMAEALRGDERIEIRGFGAFAVRLRPARKARNPRTGRAVVVPNRRSAHFTVGKELKARLNPAAQDETVQNPGLS